jgi:transposase InsO family protein
MAPLAAVLLTLLLPAAPAAADDAAVFAAYTSHAKELKLAGKAYVRAARAVRRTDWGRKAARKIISSDRLINRALTRILRDARKAGPSTDNGTEARRCMLGHYSFWRKANLIEMDAAGAGIKHRWMRLDRLYEKSNRTLAKAVPFRDCEEKAFAAAGVKR